MYGLTFTACCITALRCLPGYDSHFMDPLAGFQFESKTYHMLCGALVRLSHELCGGRCMFILEGGYHQQSLGEAVVDSFAGILGLPVLSSNSNTALPEEPLDKVFQADLHAPQACMIDGYVLFGC